MKLDLGLVLFFFSPLFFINSAFSQNLLINELMSTNSSTIYDEDNDTPDWIEVTNAGNTTVNLADYFLSDESENLLKWQFPEIQLGPAQQILVFASDKDRAQVPLHWNTVVDVGDNWKYIVPTSEPSATWKQSGYNDASWRDGKSGIGYGDNDDSTKVANGVMSVFMRIKFSVENTESIQKLLFHMDYDDGFVAYLNGTEIARSGLGTPGTNVAFNQAASSHEALIYNGQQPESFNISDYTYLLKENDNVLAVQVHNTGTNSSDLTSIPILTLGSLQPFTNEPKVSEFVNIPTLYPHTNFKLTSEGETVYISDKNGLLIDSVRFELIPGGFSYGRNIDNPDLLGLFEIPTPGAPNTTQMLNGIVTSEVQFSLNEMFLSSQQQLVLSGAGAGEEIRYTLDATEPDANSTVYTTPITINTNTPVRARIYKEGTIPGKMATRTYIFDVPSTLPVFSIVTDPENLWNNETGIYVLGDSYQNENPYYGANFWEDWEKPASIEMTETDGSQVFSLNCGIKIYGAWSRARDQKSLAIHFRKEYGDAKLDGVQLFDSKPIDEFKSLVLRNAGNDYDYTRFRDGMMTSLVSKMDNDIMANQPAVLYLNGEYWGHMNLREKINEDYIESNHVVKADELDLLENNGNILEGSNDGYWELVYFLENNNIALDANYDYVASKIDISNFIDYFVSEIYFDNRDWPGNNLKIWKPQMEGGKWRWLMYDTDFGFGLYDNSAYLLNTFEFATEPNGPGWPNPPWSTLFLRKLLENQKFKRAFINRFADMMNSTFLSDLVIQRIDSMAAILEPEVQRHYDRWWTPSYYRWQQTTENMRTFAKNRVYYLRNHIKQMYNSPAYHNLTVSTFPEKSGKIQVNSLIVRQSSWKGQYFKNYPVTLTSHSNKGYKFHSWKVNGVTMLDETIELDLSMATSVEAVFELSNDDGKTVVINEINYNSSPDYDAGDWVELFNWGQDDIDISGWIFKDDDDNHQFIIPENTIIASQGYLVLCRNSQDFQLVHPNVSNLVGDMDFGLSGSGDEVRLFDNFGTLIDSLNYGVDLPWPEEPNGAGATLELRHYTYDNAEDDSWKASIVNLGTPGKENSVRTDAKWFAGNTSDRRLMIYPNPFSQETHIELENSGFGTMDIQIYSLDGRLVFQNTTNDGEIIWNGKSNNQQSLNSGIFLCKVQSEGKVYTQKIVLYK